MLTAWFGTVHEKKGAVPNETKWCKWKIVKLYLCLQHMPVLPFININHSFFSHSYFSQWYDLRHKWIAPIIARNYCISSRFVHDDVIKWKHFPLYWPFVRGIHRSPVNSSHKGQWRGTLMFSLICAWINGWVNNREAGDLRRNRAHYDVIVMFVDFDERRVEDKLL